MPDYLKEVLPFLAFLVAGTVFGYIAVTDVKSDNLVLQEQLAQACEYSVRVTPPPYLGEVGMILAGCEDRFREVMMDNESITLPAPLQGQRDDN